jgi:hypothetical protein
MSRHVSEALNAQVVSRAGGICEYCRIAVSDTYFGGEIDHIRSLKHGGLTETSNLAFACQPCNRNKGSDLGSIPAHSKVLIRFFNPRFDIWSDHFRVNPHGEILPLSEIGEVTATIFRFNDSDRVVERAGLIEIGNYAID